MTNVNILFILNELEFNNILNPNNKSNHSDKKILVKILFVENLKIKEAINIIMTQTQDDLHKFIEQFRNEFKELPVEDISFPRSVNGLTEYGDAANIFKKGTPIHVKGALVYNHFLRELKLNKRYQEIQEGEKIKFVYLKQPNIFNNNTLAFISALPKKLGAEQYIDYDLQFEKSFLEPLDIILSAIDWQSEKIDSLDCFFN